MFVFLCKIIIVLPLYNKLNNITYKKINVKYSDILLICLIFRHNQIIILQPRYLYV